MFYNGSIRKCRLHFFLEQIWKQTQQWLTLRITRRGNAQCVVTEATARLLRTSNATPIQANSLSLFYSSSYMIHTQTNIREYAQTIPIAVLRILFEHWALNHVIAG